MSEQPAPQASSIDVVTIGETLVLFHPLQEGPLAYAPLFTRSLAGAESNLAIALARLGKRARWISRLGADPFGDLVAATLAGEGVDISQVVRDPGAPTAIFFREFRGYGDPNVYYYRAGSAASRLCPADVRDEWFQGARHLHVTGITPALGSQTAEAIESAMRRARALGLTISFDPNLRRKLWSEEHARECILRLIPLCDLFLPGLDEVEFLTGASSPDESARHLLDQGPEILVIKCGIDGASAYTRQASVHSPAYPVNHVVDTIGAGDAFDAGLLSVLLDAPPNRRSESEVLGESLARANL
ncbi:MAG TPA: sugar kinase, partial [Armatimonadota bacterium]|nr:sugar kinase [Armatimonadota bacterium]